MPPYMVRYQPRGRGWLAVVYVAQADALCPAAILRGRWGVVRRRATGLLPALLERARHNDTRDGLLVDAVAEPDHVA